MTHPQVFGQKYTPIRKCLAWKTHPFWPHTQYDPIWECPPPAWRDNLCFVTTTMTGSNQLLRVLVFHLSQLQMDDNGKTLFCFQSVIL